MKTVYLAGSINGLTSSECSDWRLEAAHTLTLQGFNVLDPLRFHRKFLPSDGVVSDQNTPINPRHIYDRDVLDIGHSDIILVNLSGIGKQTSIGTLMELGMAISQNKPVLGFGLDPKFKGHPFMSEVRMYDTFEAALEKVNIFFLVH